MQLQKLSLWLLAGGIALIAFGFVWPKLIGGRNSYTDDDAKEYLRASEDLHNKLHGHSAGVSPRDAHAHAEHKVSDEQLKSAWQDFNQAQDKRDAAVDRGKLTARIATWLGRIAAVAGLCLYFVLRQQNNS